MSDAIVIVGAARTPMGSFQGDFSSLAAHDLGGVAIAAALKRAGVIDKGARRRRDGKFKRWERGLPMELWQMDVVGGILLADGTELKCLTGVDDHSRFCVSAGLMVRANSRSVCEWLAHALRAHGVPQELLTDNGKVFTGRFGRNQTEVLFDRICRENGIDHLLTAPSSPTTTGKIERFHRTLRTEFLAGRVFADMASAQAELDAWVADYNANRPHQSLKMATPASMFGRMPAATPSGHLVDGGLQHGAHDLGHVL